MPKRSVTPKIEWDETQDELIGSDGMGIVAKIYHDVENEYHIEFTIYAPEDTPSSDVPLAVEAAAKTLRRYLGMG